MRKSTCIESGMWHQTDARMWQMKYVCFMYHFYHILQNKIHHSKLRTRSVGRLVGQFAVIIHTQLCSSLRSWLWPGHNPCSFFGTNQTQTATTDKWLRDRRIYTVLLPECMMMGAFNMYEI